MPYHLHPRASHKKVLPIDRIIAVVAIVSPLAVLPQILQIFQTQSAQGVSLVTWLASITTSSLWITYGVCHPEKPIIFNSVIGASLSCIVVLGTLLYR